VTQEEMALRIEKMRRPKKAPRKLWDKYLAALRAKHDIHEPIKKPAQKPEGAHQ